MEILYFAILLIVILISIPIYFNYEDKKENQRIAEENKKREEEFHRYVNDPEYRKQKDKELEDSLKPYSNEYHSWNDPYYNSDFPTYQTPRRTTFEDDFNDPLSPMCPWGFWSM